jgi:hypothetical protein
MGSQRQFRAVVELVIPKSSWEEDVKNLLRERAAVSGQFSAEEVERDVLEAIHQIRHPSP